MINSFGSLNKITSIKLNKSDDNNKFNCTNENNATNVMSSTTNTTPTNTTSSTNSLNKDHRLYVEDQENSIKAISGTVGIDINIPSNIHFSKFSTTFNNNNNNSVPNNIIHRNRNCIASRKINSDKYMNLHKKKIKCCELLENDKLNNSWNCSTSNDELKIERFDELIT